MRKLWEVMTEGKGYPLHRELRIDVAGHTCERWAVHAYRPAYDENFIREGEVGADSLLLDGYHVVFYLTKSACSQQLTADSSIEKRSG